MSRESLDVETQVLYRVFAACRLNRADLPLVVVNAVENVEQFYLAMGFDCDGIPRELAERRGVQ